MGIQDEGLFVLHNFGSEALSDSPNGINTGSNGGYQSLNIAYLSGAKKIILLGYDMRFPNGKSHWHSGHPVKVPEGHYSGYARKFKTTLAQLQKAGVEVINCSMGSAIDAFPIRPLQESI